MMNTIKKNFIGNLPNLLLVGFLLIIACSSPVAHIPEINPEQLRAAPINDPPPTERTYKMVPYDTIMVRFTYHPEQDPKAPVAVRPDGNITLDGIGSIRAAGLTPEELGKEIAATSLLGNKFKLNHYPTIVKKKKPSYLARLKKKL